MADKFPGPYTSTIREEDPYMNRVDQNHGEIGSRPSGMPGTMLTEKMTIEHVGNVANGPGKRR